MVSMKLRFFVLEPSTTSRMDCRTFDAAVLEHENKISMHPTSILTNFAAEDRQLYSRIATQVQTHLILTLLDALSGQQEASNQNLSARLAENLDHMDTEMHRSRIVIASFHNRELSLRLLLVITLSIAIIK